MRGLCALTSAGAAFNVKTLAMGRGCWWGGGEIRFVNTRGPDRKRAAVRHLALAGVLVAGMMAATACERRPPTWRTYREHAMAPAVSPGAAAATSPDAPPATSLRWDSPEGWTEERGTGMRLASFTVGSGGQTGLCTLVELGGDAGGLDANIRRWIKQLDLAVPGPEAWEAFIQQQSPLTTAGGLSGMIVDLTTLGSPAADRPSMMAAMFSGSGSTVFVKLTGPVALLRGEQERFAALCRSLRREN